ncbi:maleylpyruvate isomerase N-terminal domain-containing protein [Nocardia inohanensis]|uniref:maleylpyruvate isomerase N-terminal domain-containing protein n=1 Tax=Nocardia inohanensis TaxID=209246 RepID=UPI00082A0173|nr:maleylpyruvate isomerase N-terminal domain-containing protein [Nocardia inohanensis]
MDDFYGSRVDALEEIWAVWGELGAGLDEQQWRAESRCPGWDVAAIFAHHSLMPVAFDTPAELPGPGSIDRVCTAAEALRGFNEPDGLAHTLADTVADQAAAESVSCTPDELTDRFRVRGANAVRKLRSAPPEVVAPWGSTGRMITLAEGVRIVLLEATIHLLDVLRALELPPELVPATALAETAALLAELPPPVDFIEAAAGRSTASPFPILR